jgi:1-acyl-sn-glycerol-3-phosphate acyltransferase
VLSAAVRLAPRAGAADRVVRRWCRLVLALAGCRLDVRGREHLPPDEAVVLVANHASYTDVVVLLAALPNPFRFVAKREALATPFVGTIIRKVGHLVTERVDVARSVADAEAASRALRSGTSLLFFAEGTFAADPGLMPFRLGAFKAAVENGRPVVPVALHGTRRLLPANTRLPRPGRITVTVTPPLRPAATGWPEMVRLRDAARVAIAAHCGEPAVMRRITLGAAS